MLVIASAMMFQRSAGRILGQRTQRPAPSGIRCPLPKTLLLTTGQLAAHPIKPLQRCRRRIVAGAGRFAWNTILALDYKPVFQTAHRRLESASVDDRNWRESVKIIADAAGNLTASNLAGGRQDVMGRIFHRVLDTAPYDGSYYTGTAGATLLATLAIQPEDRDWNDLDVHRPTEHHRPRLWHRDFTNRCRRPYP